MTEIAFRPEIDWNVQFQTIQYQLHLSAILDCSVMFYYRVLLRQQLPQCTTLIILTVFCYNTLTFLSCNIINFNMDSTLDIFPSLSHKVIPLNPEIEEQRCRICYEESKPLITLCECSGTIAYVHEDCILDWITKKMENSETVEIPKCQICRTTYSARLKIGRKKVCPKILMRKLKEQKLNDIVFLLLYLIGSIVVIVTASETVFAFIREFFTYNTSVNNQAQSVVTNKNQEGFIVKLFTNLVFPYYFLMAAITFGKKQLKILEDSKVQIVEVTLNPKIIVKQ